jgi:hypothetical protein
MSAGHANVTEPEINTRAPGTKKSTDIRGKLR